ncbi:polyketide synthase-like protein [Xylaria sp. FL0064]|nr:polyketide synthase-like protein [Xylaria sp. FL0064]
MSAQRKLESDNDPVCIVGISCRLPGGVKSPTDMWQFLIEKHSAQNDVPLERYNVRGFYSKQGSKTGVMNVDGGYFLQEDIRQFDNEFFGINSFEAICVCSITLCLALNMDPQQRKLLEVVFECLENSGTSLNKISGSNTAVYVGNFTQDHLLMQFRDPDDLRRYHATGSGLTMLANRVSHAFNLHGPSLTLDTACSSSIYCLHLAVAALKANECDGALVAASNLIMSPSAHIAASKSGFLSPTSTCHTFDISADGYGRAEAVNAIYLKRLSSAIDNNDTIYAVIRGTATNSNGHTPGVVYPSSEFQEAVVRKAYRDANLDFCHTDYVECHGTGTELGDDVELAGLSNCFSSGRDNSSLKIGGSKPNFGHSEAASSLTSVIKICLAFQRGILPPTRGIEKINPKLQLELRKMEVVTEAQTWPNELQRASICSSGYGGANAHAILDSFRRYTGGSATEVCPKSSTAGLWLVLAVSAASATSLEARVDRVLQIARSLHCDLLQSLAYTLGERLSHFPYRKSILINCCETQPDKHVELEVITCSDSSTSNSKQFAFVFTGQGAQYPGMGKELLDKDFTFLSTIRELDEVLQSLPSPYTPDWRLENALRENHPASYINDVTRSQPLCTAVQIALVNVLRSWGVKPVATVGHSSGEIAAAYASGLISYSQAIIAAYFRGYTVARGPACGAMLACGLSAVAANELVHKLGLTEKITVACFNAPSSVTVSGSREAVELIHSELQQHKIFCRLLQTGGRAYHSFMMKEIGDSYEELIKPYFPNGVHTREACATMHSSVYCVDNTPSTLDGSVNMARYWRDNLEKPVQFDGAVRSLIKSGEFHIIEVGPHPALKAPVNQTYTDAKQGTAPQTIVYSASLVREKESNVCMQKLAGELFVHGYDLCWRVINPIPEQNRTLFQDLPPYPWDYSNGLKWTEPRSSVELRNRPYPRHELLGSEQLTGDGGGWSWRNVLHVDEVPWIRDHRIGKQVIFPAAGYLAMIVEAAMRIFSTGERVATGPTSFEFQNVNINSAMVLPEHEDLQTVPLELHTTMAARKLSARTMSTSIYDFSISTWTKGQSVIHCVGAVQVSSVPSEKTVHRTCAGLEAKWTVEKWRQRFNEEGVHFGPYFQSLKSVQVDKNHVSSCVKCTTHIQPPETRLHDARYAVHPVAIDACLQASLISASRGDPEQFRCLVPVSLSRCCIQKPSLAGSDECGTIHAQTQKTGFSSFRADCALEDRQGLIVVEMEGVKLSKFLGQDAQDESAGLHLQRNPVLRIRWKPDIMRLTPDAVPYLESYIESLLKQHAPFTTEQEVSLTIGALLDLAGHKNPRMRVIRIGEDSYQPLSDWLDILGQGTTFPRIESCHSYPPNSDAQVAAEILKGDGFDTLIHDDHSCQSLWDSAPSHLVSLVAKNGVVITRNSKATIAQLSAAGFSAMVIRNEVLLAIRKTKRTNLNGRVVILSEGRELSSCLQELQDSLIEALLARGVGTVEAVTLDQLPSTDLSDAILCVSILEMEVPFLATLSQKDLDLLHRLIDTFHNIIWLTGANMLGVPKPDLTLVHGLFRALQIERPSLRLGIMDIGWYNANSFHMPSFYNELISALESFADDDESEFVLSNGLIQVSRFEPDGNINSIFRRRTARETNKHETMPLSDTGLAVLGIGNVGFTDSIYFQQVCEPSTQPPYGHVNVQVKAVSLNAKDIYAMSGRVETRSGTSALEFCGVITDVGPGVSDIEVGDRVVVLKPNNFSTTERVPAWTVHKLLPGEEFAEMATLPTIYSSALYAIRDRGQLRAGESILIHSGAGAFGIAAITLAQRIGAVVYTTAGSEARRQFLVEHLGVPSSHIFNSRDDSFVVAIQSVTKGRGADVVVNSLTGELMHASWRCVAPFGRFIEIGKREIVDDGRLDMQIFSRSTTFTAFDLSEMFYQEGNQHEILMAGYVTFGAYAAAYRYFSSKDRIGKVVITLTDSKSLIPVAPARYQTLLESGKVYLMVGALGGLGRSLAQWMLSRGARKFVFLQRSGCDKPGIQDFVDQLRQSGAKVVVIKGDVSVFDDVAKSVAACETLGGPLGGVVQMAMGLHESIFDRMTHSGWHASVKPKWSGTWNIHHAINGRDEALDFFLVTSSMNGSVGTPTESNYCAANAFLDAFAFYRRSLGKPATSLALGLISDAGYIHENPGIEELHLRRGAQPLSENDFLVLADLAIGGCKDGASSAVAPPHILTGLETTGIRRLLEQGFEVTNAVIEDPRFSFLAASIEANQAIKEVNLDSGLGIDAVVNSVPWLRSLPIGAARILSAEDGASSLHDSILRVLRRRFSHLLLTPVDQIDDRRSYAQMGIDSMIAAEFRTWLWNSFKVDVPFLDLLSHDKSIISIASLVEQSLIERE